MKSLIQALIKARAKFPPIEKDKTNPHFKNSYASLDSVLDAVTPVLCDNGLAILQTVDAATKTLQTHLFHESGETISSNYPLPDIQDAQKMGSAVTYARRYSICALLSITADEDTDGNNGAKTDKSPAKTPAYKTKTPAEAMGETIRQVREFLGVEKSWVEAWLSSHQMSISKLKTPDQLIKDMCIDWAVSQGVDDFHALEVYTDNIKATDLSAIQNWKQLLFKGD